MAYTKAPMVSTYQTKTIPLMEAWETRNITGNKDVNNVNVVWDVIRDQTTGEQYFEAIKRDGCVNFVSPDPGGSCLGLYFWDFYALTVVVTSAFIRAYDSSGNLALSVASPYVTDTHIGFTPFLYDSGVVTLIITDGTTLGELTSAGVFTVVVDPDRPIPHLPYPVFLDGYLFLADLKGNIQNSDLNNPQSWTAGNLISVESYSDAVKAIARHGQYIVAFGGASIQFYYDAANPTGTPLAAQTTVLRVGFTGGLTDYKDTLLFIGMGANGKAGLYQLEGLKANSIASPSLQRRLEKYTGYYNSNFSREGNILNINGHTLYTWTDNPYNTQPVQNTYMYDLDSGIVSGLEFKSGVSSNGGFPLRSAVTISTNTELTTVFVMYGGPSSSPFPIQKFSSTAYQDLGVAFNVKIQTKATNFGTMRIKFGSRILFDCDQTDVNSTMVVQYDWTDGKNYTISTPINLNDPYPVQYGIGRFREISFRVTYSDNFPMRWRGIEMDYNQGDA